jgi:dynactin complex subunit
MKLKSTCSRIVSGHRISAASIAAVMAGIVIAGSVSAASLNNIVSEEQKKLKVAQASQVKVDELSEERRKLYNEFKAVNKEIEGLQIYNKQVSKQIVNQRAEMERIRQTMEDVQVTQRQITPLMLRMIEGMKQFMALDMPFLVAERQKRIELLEDIIDDTNVSVAEKFRLIINAYQREMEYGNTIESYSTTLPIDEVDRNVNILRFGRVAMVYQTPDGKYSGYWNEAEGQWVESNGSSERSNISNGLKIANKQAAPDLVILPVKGPEAAQ